VTGVVPDKDSGKEISSSSDYERYPSIEGMEGAYSLDGESEGKVKKDGHLLIERQNDKLQKERESPVPWALI